MLRSSVRKYLKEASSKAIAKYKEGEFTFLDKEGCKFYEYYTNTGCISAKAFICDSTPIGESPWIKINLNIYVVDTINDGESFE